MVIKKILRLKFLLNAFIGSKKFAIIFKDNCKIKRRNAGQNGTLFNRHYTPKNNSYHLLPNAFNDQQTCKTIQECTGPTCSKLFKNNPIFQGNTMTN
jgi:hypothetical protein